MRALLAKDLRILRRSPLLVALLVIYPIALALLIGFALSKPPGPPRVALLNEAALAGRPIEIAGKQLDPDLFGRQLAQQVDVVPVRTSAEALAKVRDGEVLAAIVVPEDMGVRVTSGQRPRIETYYSLDDPVKAQFVESAIKARIADANLEFSGVLSKEAGAFVGILRDGGSFGFGGRGLEILGLRRAHEIAAEQAARQPAGSRARRDLEQVARFTQLGFANLGSTGNLLKTLSAPIDVGRTVVEGRRTPLDTFAVAVAVAISLMFVTVLLAAGALALEREERTFARLVRGLVSRSGLLVEKVLLAAGCAAAVAILMTCGLGAFVHLEWSRFGQWVAAIVAGALGFGALGVAIGALTREVRAASLLAFLLSLPIAFLALVPSGAVDQTLYDVTRVISALFPFKPTLDALDAAFNGGGGLLAPLAHLAAVTLGFGVLARLALRRFA